MKDLSKIVLSSLIDNPSQKDSSRFDINCFPEIGIISKTLDEMLPEQINEDKTVQKAREILGNEYSSEQTRNIIASFEYLIENWLENYEKTIFNKKTLKELLQSF